MPTIENQEIKTSSKILLSYTHIHTDYVICEVKNVKERAGSQGRAKVACALGAIGQ